MELAEALYAWQDAVWQFARKRATHIHPRVVYHRLNLSLRPEVSVAAGWRVCLHEVCARVHSGPWALKAGQGIMA